MIIAGGTHGAVEARLLRPLTTLVLGSGSPRRRQLLTDLGLRFRVDPAAVDECRWPGEAAADFVCRMAAVKAAEVGRRNPDSWVLTADTIVVGVDGEPLGKPVDAADARRMLRRLDGCWHTVFTAYVLCRGPLDDTAVQRIDAARVRLDFHAAAYIDAYIATGEPLDKAGAYAIQGLGAAFVSGLAGAPLTVVGLPLHLLLPDLERCGIVAPRGGTA
jgi:septum formation protein